MKLHGEPRLPGELKKILIDIGIHFSEWCDYYNFHRVTARNVAAGIIRGSKPDTLSSAIMAQLRKDFPSIYDEERQETVEETTERVCRIRGYSPKNRP